MAAWKNDPASWGLRGYEQQHPDSNRIHRELDSRGRGHQGVVGSGYLERVRARTYRLTPKGLAAAAAVEDAGEASRERVNRVFENEVTRVIEHPAFLEWIQNPDNPRSFREIGHFWGVAPGTPPRVVRQRVQGVEDTLTAALDLLERRELNEVGDRHGRLLFDRADVERGLEFHVAMKTRFAADLRVLGGLEDT